MTFKEGNTEYTKRNPDSARPWSVQNAVRYFAGQAPGTPLPENHTFAQKIAHAQLMKAAEGDSTAFEKVTERIDGKVVQTNINADLDRLNGMSEEELSAERTRVAREIAALERAINSGGSADAPAEAGNDGIAAESANAQAAADAPEISLPGHT